jgi:hypothetical protein
MRIWAGLLAGAALLQAGKGDLDRDGLPEKLEQALLERFTPELILSGEECDGLPAELAAGARDPRVVARNGVLYGQAFRKGSRLVELHYYHLWGRDCGRAGHALDAEHVSALVEADRPGAPAKKWRARYWYAAGHEGTVCNRSNGAKAAALGAVDRGPRVWVSVGKHASYLDASYCSWGCGADRCAVDGPRWRAARVVNIGERGAPLNGADWAESKRWNLAQKLRSDFWPEFLSAMDKSTGVILLWPELRPAQPVLMAGSEVGAALAESSRRTGAALRLADSETGEALAASMQKTGLALKRSARSVARFLRRGTE